MFAGIYRVGAEPPPYIFQRRLYSVPLFGKLFVSGNIQAVIIPHLKCLAKYDSYKSGIILPMVSWQKIVRSTQLRKIPWQKISYLVVAGLLLSWLLNTPAGLLGKADAIGYAVCHRIDLRSFHLGDRQLPLCARCTGQYLGAVLGILYHLVIRPRRTGRPPKWIIAVLGVLALGFVLDGTNSYLYLLFNNYSNFPKLHIYIPNNVLRVITGTGLGIGVSVMLLPAFHQTVWKKWDRRPALDGIESLTSILALGLILDLVALTENPLILYPLALISTAGIPALLTLVYTMVWVMLFRLENTFERWSDLVFPLVTGFTVALLQIAVIDYVRYLFTGTWGGFPFG